MIGTNPLVVVVEIVLHDFDFNGVTSKKKEVHPWGAPL